MNSAVKQIIPAEPCGARIEESCINCKLYLPNPNFLCALVAL